MWILGVQNLAHNSLNTLGTSVDSKNMDWFIFTYINPCNHHSNQDSEHSQHSSWLPHIPPVNSFPKITTILKRLYFKTKDLFLFSNVCLKWSLQGPAFPHCPAFPKQNVHSQVCSVPNARRVINVFKSIRGYPAWLPCWHWGTVQVSVFIW